jgi:hypothetical protein
MSFSRKRVASWTVARGTLWFDGARKPWNWPSKAPCAMQGSRSRRCTKWGPHLLRHADRFPVWFTDDLPRLSEISGRLRREREASFYGDEASGVAPEAMYDEADAKEALAEATIVLDRCRHLVRRD